MKTPPDELGGVKNYGVKCCYPFTAPAVRPLADLLHIEVVSLLP